SAGGGAGKAARSGEARPPPRGVFLVLRGAPVGGSTGTQEAPGRPAGGVRGGTPPGRGEPRSHTPRGPPAPAPPTPTFTTTPPAPVGGTPPRPAISNVIVLRPGAAALAASSPMRVSKIRAGPTRLNMPGSAAASNALHRHRRRDARPRGGQRCPGLFWLMIPP